MRNKISIFWFRRDLRLRDNRGLQQALLSGYPVLPVFIFDLEILDGLARDDSRVTFIHDQLQRLREELQSVNGSSIATYHGKPENVFRALTGTWDVQAVFTNRDYEPYARQRDTAVRDYLRQAGIEFHSFKDHVLFEEDEIVKKNGDPYVVYTPYMRSWRESFSRDLANPCDTAKTQGRYISDPALPNPGLDTIGFVRSPVKIPGFDLSGNLLSNYGRTRDIPGIDGTSHLGPHLRFGTLSVREAYRKALEVRDDTFLKELIWREFFIQILWHYPETVNSAFKPDYDRIQWRNNEGEFDRWKSGTTGFALVDAGMRQLNATGYMHNRVRMLVASFLCKHLLIDWRWGEAYFASKLIDFELASNIGNWQWASGSGVDAAPYFRIFNPILQADKFDPDRSYVRRWVPEFGTDGYPAPMVDHKTARLRCLEAYKKALR